MKHHTLLLFVFLLGLLSACAPADLDQGAAEAVINQPENNTTFLLGEQVIVITSIEHPGGAQSAALFANGQLIREDELTAAIYSGTMLQGWIPSSAGTYQVQVLFTSASGTELLSDAVEITVGAEYAEENLVILDLVTPEPEVVISPTPTVTTEPVAPTVTGNQDTNCRRGPSTSYQNIGTLFEAQSAPIVGRLADNSWWVIDLDSSSENCWVWTQLVTVSGDTSGVPIYAVPPLPLAAPLLVTPDDDISCSSLASVTFVWESVDGATAYEYQIQSANAPDGPFSGYAGGDTGETETTEDVICGSSIYYRWRVKALDSSGEGPWSDWSVFKAGF